MGETAACRLSPSPAGRRVCLDGSRRRRPRTNRGFTLIEVLVTMAILALVMVGFLTLFDSSAKIAK
ncbi:MAG: type II secretion system protein, partial [Acidobacteriota bacterium]